MSQEKDFREAAAAASEAPRPLIVVSSRTGNTMILAHAICDALPGALLVRPSELPEDLSPFNPVLLGFWCDRGHAPEEMIEAARRLHGKRIGCFATMGGNPEDRAAKDWMTKTAEALVKLGTGNELAETFLCRGRIDPSVFERMTAMMGGVVTPEREARRQASETHPDRLDLARGAEIFRGVFGANW